MGGRIELLPEEGGGGGRVASVHTEVFMFKFSLFLSFQLFERKLMLIETFVTSLGRGWGARGRGDWEATTGVNTKKRYNKEIRKSQNTT